MINHIAANAHQNLSDLICNVHCMVKFSSKLVMNFPKVVRAEEVSHLRRMVNQAVMQKTPLMES